MSHFCVAIFAEKKNDFDRLLDPYSENDESYFVEQLITGKSLEDLKNSYDKIKDKNSYPTFKEYAESWGYYWRDDELYCRNNPDAIYDYYSLDAKAYQFEDCLISKRSYGEKLKDYNFFKRVSPAAVRSLKKEWAEIERFSAMSDEEFEKHKEEYSMFFNPKYLKNRYGTEAQYIKEHTACCPYCFITPDGVLHAPGRVGWFATDDATAESWNKYYQEWIDFVTGWKDYYVSFADCHI